jgi:hypothetical protein
MLSRFGFIFQIRGHPRVLVTVRCPKNAVDVELRGLRIVNPGSDEETDQELSKLSKYRESRGFLRVFTSGSVEQVSHQWAQAASDVNKRGRGEQDERFPGKLRVFALAQVSERARS